MSLFCGQEETPRLPAPSIILGGRQESHATPPETDRASLIDVVFPCVGREGEGGK